MSQKEYTSAKDRSLDWVHSKNEEADIKESYFFFDPNEDDAEEVLTPEYIKQKYFELLLLLTTTFNIAVETDSLRETAEHEFAHYEAVQKILINREYGHLFTDKLYAVFAVKMYYLGKIIWYEPSVTFSWNRLTKDQLLFASAKFYMAPYIARFKIDRSLWKFSSNEVSYKDDLMHLRKVYKQLSDDTPMLETLREDMEEILWPERAIFNQDWFGYC